MIKKYCINWWTKVRIYSIADCIWLPLLLLVFSLVLLIFLYNSFRCYYCGKRILNDYFEEHNLRCLKRPRKCSLKNRRFKTHNSDKALKHTMICHKQIAMKMIGKLFSNGLDGILFFYLDCKTCKSPMWGPEYFIFYKICY